MGLRRMKTSFLRCFAVIAILAFTCSDGTTRTASRVKSRAATGDQIESQSSSIDRHHSPNLESSILQENDITNLTDWAEYSQKLSALAKSFFDKIAYDKLVYGLPMLLAYFKVLFYLQQKCPASTSLCTLNYTSTFSSSTTWKTTLSTELTSTKMSVIHLTFISATTTTSTSTPTTTTTLFGTMSQSTTQTLEFTESIISTSSNISTLIGMYTSVSTIKGKTQTTSYKSGTVTETIFIINGKRRKDILSEEDEEDYMTDTWSRSWQEDLPFAVDDDEVSGDLETDSKDLENLSSADDSLSVPNIESSKDAVMIETIED